MSRRKQTKPQQLNSPTDIAASDCHCKTHSDHSSSDYSECMATSGREINNNNPIKCEEKEQLIFNNKLSSQETKANESEMATDEHILGANESASVDGNLSPNSRVSMNGSTKENDDSDEQSTHSQDENVESVDEKRMNQIVGEGMNKEKMNTSHGYGSDTCGRSFTHLPDFVQHKKSSRSEQDEVEMNGDKTQQQVDEVVFNSINGTNVAVAQMTAQQKEEDFKSSDNDVSDDETRDVNDPPPHENSGFLSSSAINNVIQSMKHLEEGLSVEEQSIGEDGRPKSKVDITGIKDQVKMIQQQQAYQIQMLNYLHWQLAMLSSNPQAAIQQVASSMRGAFPGPMPGQAPGAPPPMPPTSAPGLMPSMMAAMAMNGAGSPNMDMAAKARMMMNMQNGNPHFRSMFGRNLSGEDIERKNDNVSTGSFDPQNEQRYQLQEPPADIEKFSRMQNSDRSAVSPAKSEESLTRKSPSSQSFDSISMVTKPELQMSLSDNTMHHGRDSSSSSPFKDDSSENSAYRHRCKYCQKVFGSDSALQIHLRSHTGERPYKCNICGNRFTTKGNLKVHFMRHKAKYPHIPMNPHPVPEYLDGVPTTTGLPYGMSILPEKAVFERPRLHGNPSIHLNSHTNSAIPSSAANTGAFPYPNISPEQPRPAFPLNGPAEFALMQSQLIERQRQLEMMGKQRNEENNSRSSTHPDKESKPSASMLQMAMMPFFKSGGIGSMMQNERQHQHDGNSDGRSSYSSSGSSSPPQRRNPSETSKLQRLVENIDRGRVLQKNECHMCHRVLSCQSALKLHYRTHTGERPHKCDLCSRAFTTRGNLRTHYSSVHRQQLRALPPGGASRAGSYSCPLCHMRFFDVMEFQRHMHTHAAVMQQKNEEETEKEERAPRITPDRELEEDVDMKMGEADEARNISVEEDENELQIDEENEEVKASNDRKEEERNALDLSSPAASTKTNEEPSPIGESENAKEQANFPSESHMHPMNDGERAQLNRSMSREAVCELCDKSFSCNSALEIHMRCHTKERPYICRICQRGFTTKGNLKQHLLMHNITDVPEEMLEPIASPDGRASNSNSPSSSSASAQYNREMASPSLKRSFDSDSSGNNGPAAKQRQFPRHWCHICQKQFSSASSLQIHTRTHTGEKPFACSVCGRAFTTKGNLKVHMGTHVFGAGGSRRGRRISMDNPLISPWMRNIANQAPAPGMQMPPQNTRADPALLYQQYAALANGLLAGKQEGDLMGMNSNRLLAINAGLMGQHQNTSPATSPQNASASPSQMRMPPAAMNNPAMAQAATEWFLKAYQQRTQEQVN